MSALWEAVDGAGVGAAVAILALCFVALWIVTENTLLRRDCRALQAWARELVRLRQRDREIEGYYREIATTAHQTVGQLIPLALDAAPMEGARIIAEFHDTVEVLLTGLEACQERAGKEAS